MTTTTYMRTFYPGTIVANTEDIVVKDRTVPPVWPKNCYAIAFFDITQTYMSGEMLRGEPKNWSPTYYKGCEHTAEEVLAHAPNTILAHNVKANGWRRLVRTIVGNWQPLNDNDVVVKP